MSNIEQKYGFIIIDKPLKITSFGVIYQLRKITGIKKIGHAGTLDPLATGVLMVAIGRQATRQIDNIVQKRKEYIAEIDLSANTDTYDMEGKITETFNNKISKEKVEKVLKTFLGKQEQIPPMFSAKKINGKKLYELARQGKETERTPSNIEIYKIKLLEYNYPVLKIDIECSKGTYIRSLAYDIGIKLEGGGHLISLRRTAIGKYYISMAKKLAEINKDNWQDLLFLPE